MGKSTAIEWADHTWSPWRGCEHATLADGSRHPGCDNCYAEALSTRNPGVLGVWGSRAQGASRVVNASWGFFDKWNLDAAVARTPALVFPSLCDPFEEWDGPMRDVSGGALRWDGKDGRRKYPAQWATTGTGPEVTMDSVADALFRESLRCDSLVFTLLTKRPENVIRKLPTVAVPFGPGLRASRLQVARMKNAMLLYSASDQASYDSGLESLLRCWPYFPILGLSLEPLLGSIDLRLDDRFCVLHSRFGCRPEQCGPSMSTVGQMLRWVITGGESGPDARPCYPDWVRDICDVCSRYKIPFFHKQWGEWCVAHELPPDLSLSILDVYPKRTVVDNDTDHRFVLHRVGKKNAGAFLWGKVRQEYPPLRWEYGHCGWEQAE